MPVIDRIASFESDMRAWRQGFHAHPELEFDVDWTAQTVARLLRGLGCDEVITGVGRTGVVGIVKGSKTNSQKVIGIRADMDALPIYEQTGLPYASKHPGKMHACGHDGHMAMVLGAARYLTETRAFDGTAVVIFQPAEELGGGAHVMIEDGLMDRFGIDEIYALHNMPGLAVNHIATRHGTLFAASDNFEIVLMGRGGHAAQPHETIDPIACIGQLVSALQHIVSRNTDPLKACVVSITAIQCGDTYNVIPDTGRLLGTVRALEDDVRLAVEERMRSKIDLIAKSFGTETKTSYVHEYPATVNHRTQTNLALKVAANIVGSDRVDAQAQPLMGCEDFAYMLQARPGAYILLGNGNSAPVHHPGYDFNDEILSIGASYFARLVETAMPA